MCENDFYIFVPNDLDLWPSNLVFVPLVTLDQRYVSTKLEEVTTAFLFRENRRYVMDGRSDGRGATRNAVP